MRRMHPWTAPVHEDETGAANRQTDSLAGLALALAVIVVGLFLIHALHRETAIEDCLLAGRSNCVAVPAPNP